MRFWGKRGPEGEGKMEDKEPEKIPMPIEADLKIAAFTHIKDNLILLDADVLSRTDMVNGSLRPVSREPFFARILSTEEDLTSFGGVGGIGLMGLEEIPLPNDEEIINVLRQKKYSGKPGDLFFATRGAKQYCEAILKNNTDNQNPEVS